jgi:hypothetical protein
MERFGFHMESSLLHRLPEAIHARGQDSEFRGLMIGSLVWFPARQVVFHLEYAIDELVAEPQGPFGAR